MHTLQYNTIQCNAIQYNTIQYNTIHLSTTVYSGYFTLATTVTLNFRIKYSILNFEFSFFFQLVNVYGSNPGEDTPGDDATSTLGLESKEENFLRENFPHGVRERMLLAAQYLILAIKSGNQVRHCHFIRCITDSLHIYVLLHIFIRY